MIPLESVQRSLFEPLVGKTFLLHAANQTVELSLHQVKAAGEKWPGANREPFVLTLAGPSGLRAPQAIYRFEVPDLGELEMFITQTGDGADGSRFEAVFT